MDFQNSSNVSHFSKVKKVSKNYKQFLKNIEYFRWQQSIAGVSLGDIGDIRERNSASRLLDINFNEEIEWVK